MGFRTSFQFHICFELKMSSLKQMLLHVFAVSKRSEKERLFLPAVLNMIGNNFKKSNDSGEFVDETKLKLS